MSWPLVEVQSVCSLLTDGTHYTPPDVGNGVPFLTVRDVSDKGLDFLNCSKISESEFIKADLGNSAPKKGDVLFSKDGTVGKVHVVEENVKFAILSSLAILRPSNKLDSKYLGYVLKSPLAMDQAIKTKTGSALRRVILSDLKRIKIPLPPLPEQKRIAAILDKADAICRKRQQAIKLADDFLRSVFLEMFGDPVTNPKGWEVKPLIELCSEKMQNGAYYPKECYADNGIEMVHMSDAFYDTVQRGSLKRVICSHEDVERYNLNENQLLISRRSLTYEGAAKPSLVPKSTEPLIFESSLIRVCPSQDKILARFLFQYLSTESVKEQHVRKYVTGATIKGISQKNLEKISVYVPPIALQKKFVEKVSHINGLVEKASSHSAVASIFFDALSQKAFSGNL